MPRGGVQPGKSGMSGGLGFKGNPGCNFGFAHRYARFFGLHLGVAGRF